MPTKTIYRNRKGYVCATINLLNILKRLREAKESGHRFIPLPDCHTRSITALLRRSWIVGNLGPHSKESRYAITALGLKVLAAFKQERRRRDGLCPACGVNERGVYQASGRRMPYCKECEGEKQRAQYKRRGSGKRPEGLCTDCGEKQRLTYPNGLTISYCADCRKKYRKEERARKHKNLLARIAEGEFLPCYTCRVKPRHHTDKTVYDYCEDCQREYQQRYKQAKREGVKRQAKKTEQRAKQQAYYQAKKAKKDAQN